VVGGNHGERAIELSMLHLGIDHHRQRSAGHQVAEGIQEVPGDHAFGVVRDNDAVQVREAFVKEGQDARPGIRLEGRSPFPVKPDHLLVMSDDAGLDRGRAAVLGDEAGSGYRNLVEQRHQGLSCRILPDDPGDQDPASKAGEIVGHVGRTAQELRFFTNLDHRYRSFRGNAVDFAPDKVVQHEVADHQHLPLGKMGDSLRKALLLL